MIVALLCAATAINAPGQPERLRTEYLTDPLAIDETAPRFSWEVRDPARGAVQTAYQLLVATDAARLRPGDADLWDSGRVDSSETCQVEYAGAPLEAYAHCVWTVRTWDGNGRPSPWAEPARFAVGPRAFEEWQARWIADPSPVPVGQDARNGYHSALEPTTDIVKWVSLDLGSEQRVDAVRLWPARPFNYADTPGFLFPTRFRVDVASSPDEWVTVVDRTEEDQPSPGDEAQTYRFPATEARFVRLTVTRLAEREPGACGFALAEMEVLADDAVVSAGAEVSAADSTELAGWSLAFLCDGDLRSHDAMEVTRPATMLRRELHLPAAPLRATLYATARGVYELSVNGQRVSNRVLAPEWTDYRTRIQYQAYDVTRHLQEGDNALGVMLGDGWYAGRVGFAWWPRGMYGHQTSFLGRLVVELADGTRQVLVTDGQWRSTQEGPVRVNDLMIGELQDGRLEMPGWDQPEFDDSAWAAAEVVEAPEALLVAQPNEPISVIEELPAVALSEPQPGVHVFDLGQNMVGVARLRLRAPAGTQVTLRHAEVLQPDTGMIYTDNLRGAPQIDTYIARGGGEEVFQPRFTQHGFRYVEVTGLSEPPQIGDLTGIVFNSAAPELGAFECSNALVNQLWRNIRWTQRANLMSVPTDCPQRDERLGWAGDIQAFSQTAIFNMDMAAFLGKWLLDMRDAQSEDGRFSDYAPNPNGVSAGAPAWGDAGVIVAWRMYVNYGDTRLLREHFDAMRRWIGYIHGMNPNHLWREGRNADYNDWLNGDTLILEGYPKQGGAIPKEVFATAFYAHSAELVARMAEALGDAEEARRHAALGQAIRQAFVEAYVDEEGRILGDTQAGYALALHFDLLPEELRPLVVERLTEALARYDNRLSTGIQSTHRMMLELSKAVRDDLAYGLLLSRERPSWGYMIDQGATTIWERWDGYVEGRGYQDPGMNSFNHWALGSVGEWLYSNLLGLSPDPEAPGWRHFIVQPRPGGGIRWARGSYHSIRGPIEVDWRLEGGEFILNVRVPANTRATVVMPGGGTQVIEAGRYTLREPASPQVGG